MKFVKVYASKMFNPDDYEVIEINSLEEIIECCKEHDSGAIIRKETHLLFSDDEKISEMYNKTDGWELMVYDDWVE